MAAYASTTSVSVEKTEAEIKSMLRKHGADRMMVGDEPGRAIVSFEMKGRRIIFRLPLPLQTDRAFLFDGRGSQRPVAKRTVAWEQACRSRWRALFLCIKAKLESVESNIETFDDAFMPHIMMPDGSTVSENVTPRIATAYATQKMHPLLPPPAEAGKSGKGE